MKVLLFLLLPLFSLAQQDFDYTLYTRHSQCPVFLNPDSSMTELSIERRIVKEGSDLRIIPCSNTGNADQYILHFEGFQFDSIPPINRFFFGNERMLFFDYVTDDMKYRIKIIPDIPLVDIYEFKSGKLYDRYY